MANVIKVTPEELINMSQKLESWNDQYTSCYRKILSAVSDLNSTWGGDAQLAYAAQVQNFEDDFQKLDLLFNHYASYLRQTANKYQTTEDSIKQAAGQISTGI